MKETPELDQTKIAVINTNISYIQRDVNEIKTGIKELAGVYVTKPQFDDLQKSVDGRLVSVEKSRNFWRVVSPLMSSALTAIATFLLIFFLQNVKH